MLTATDTSSQAQLAKSMAEALKVRPKAEPHPGKLPCRVVPYEKNTNFVGRTEILTEIRGMLLPEDPISAKQQTSVQICGAGGVGKTQTAVSFVFENWDKYQAILVASADQEDKLLASYAEFAYKLGLTPSITGDQKENVELAMSWFENASRSTLRCETHLLRL